MRDLLFKNLTSEDNRRKVLIKTETMQQNGIVTKIQRRLICLVKDPASDKDTAGSPTLYVRKFRDTRNKTEKFYCRLKGSMYAISNDQLFLICFSHSLKIDLSSVTN